MNLGTMRTYVRTLLSEDAAAFWTDAMLNVFIQRSFVQVYGRACQVSRGFFQKTATIAYVAGQELYTLPNDGLVKLDLVERFDTTPYVNVLPIDIVEKNDYQVVNSGGYPPGAERFFLSGNSIGIAPIPATAVSNALRIWYVPGPTVPAADGDTFPLDLTDLHHECCAWGAYMRASMRDKQQLANMLPTYQELQRLLVEDTQIRQTQEPKRIIDMDPQY